MTDDELQSQAQRAFSEVYISLGRCTAQLQFLEFALTRLLAAISTADKTSNDDSARREQLDMALQGLTRKTLGQLVGEMQALSASPYSPLDNDFCEQLRQFNKTRIWAIHSCTDEIDENIVDDDTRHGFCRAIDDITFNAAQLQEQITTMMADFLSRQGVDVVGARQRANSRIKTAMGVDFDTSPIKAVEQRDEFPNGLAYKNKNTTPMSSHG
jgi:hypothetical protein